MHLRPFKQVDVFSDQPYRGNPLAVVVDGDGLSSEAMQRFAHWTNLSETTFLLPPSPEAAARGADYQVRIFTTTYEMPFAGHPTLGSCHAWLEHGGVAKNPGVVLQECKVGLVPIRQLGQRSAFAAPPLRHWDAEPAQLEALILALGLAPSAVQASQFLNNGPSHFGILIDSRAQLLDLRPNLPQLGQTMHDIGVTGVGIAAHVARHVPTPDLIARSNREARAFASHASDRATAPPAPDTRDAHPQTNLEVRFFFDHGSGVSEDPVTGSFNASLAQWLIAQGHTPSSYTAAQGTCLGVQGRVHIEQDSSGQVWVGGDAVTCVDGTVLL